MATEALNTYTESDTGGYLSETADRVTVTAVPSRNATAYLYYDKGVNHFDGDFEHRLKVETQDSNDGNILAFWMLSNALGDVRALRVAEEDFLSASWVKASGTLTMRVREQDGANTYTDTSSALSEDTTYYCTAKRDEAVGTYGTFYLYICTTNYYGETGASLVDTLTLTLHTSKKDFKYIFGVASYNDGDNEATMTMWMELLDLQEATHTVIDTTCNLSLSPSLDRDFGISRITSSNLALSSTIGRAVGWIRAITIKWTFYPVVDCYWDAPGTDTDYDAAHDAASGTVNGGNVLGVDNDWRPAASKYWVYRAGIQFDTSSIPDATNIISASLYLYKQSKEETDSGQAATHIVNGADLNDSPVEADYGDLLDEITSGGSISYGDVADDGYSCISLNSTGISWISKTGRTKLGLRAAGDINDTIPTGHNYIDWYSSEKGKGYKPKLVVEWEAVTPCNLSMSPSLSRTLTFNRVSSSNITASVSISRAMGYARDIAANLSLAVSLIKSWGRFIATSCNLAFSTTISRLVGWTRTSSSNLTVSASVSRAMGYIRDATANLSLAISLTKSWGRSIATSCNLALATTVGRLVAWGRASTSNLSLTSTLSRIRGWTTATTTNLSLSTTISRLIGYARTTSPALNLSVSVSRLITYARATTSNLTLVVSITKSWGRTVVTSTGLTMATSVSRLVGWARDTTSNLTLQPTISRALAWARATTSNLSIAPTVSRLLAYARETSSNLSLTASISRILGYVKAITTNLDLTASVSRIMAYARATSSNLSLRAIIASFQRLLVIKVLTAQYRLVKAITAQYRLVNIITSQFRNIKTWLSGG